MPSRHCPCPVPLQCTEVSFSSSCFRKVMDIDSESAGGSPAMEVFLTGHRVCNVMSPQ